MAACAGLPLVESRKNPMLATTYGVGLLIKDAILKGAKEKSVPVIAVVGGVDGDISEAYGLGVNAVFTINQMPEDFSVSRYKSEENLEKNVDNIFKSFKKRKNIRSLCSNFA